MTEVVIVAELDIPVTVDCWLARDAAHHGADLILDGHLPIVPRATGNKDGAVRVQRVKFIDHETFETVFKGLDKQ